MVKHTDTWAYLCIALVSVLRNLAEVKEKYIDSAMSLITVEEFVRNATRLEFVCSELKPHPQLLKYLQDASELRKLNSGLAPTVQMEDVYGSIYMKLYQSLPSLEEQLNLMEKEQIIGINKCPCPDEIEDDGSLEVKEAAVSEETSNDMLQDQTIKKSKILASVSSPMNHGDQMSGSRSKTARVTRKEVLSKANALLKPAIIGELLNTKD